MMPNTGCGLACSLTFACVRFVLSSILFCSLVLLLLAGDCRFCSLGYFTMASVLRFLKRGVEQKEDNGRSLPLTDGLCSIQKSSMLGEKRTSFTWSCRLASQPDIR